MDFVHHMDGERYSLGRIEETKDPWIEEQRNKLDDRIASNSELQARIQMLRNQFLGRDSFFKMISGWNDDHRQEEWVGAYVERVFKGVNGQVLRIRMDSAGNIKLAGSWWPEK